MTEIWRPVVEDPLYEVSSLGRVRSLDATIWYGPRVGFGKRKGRILKPSVDGRGYLTVRLSKRRTAAVHRIVAAAFLGPRPPGQVARHMDGDKTNPKLSNLEYGTQKENHADSYRHGTRNAEVNLAMGRNARNTKDARYGRHWIRRGFSGERYSKQRFDL